MVKEEKKELCWHCVVRKSKDKFSQKNDWTRNICNDCVDRLKRELKIGGYDIIEKDKKPHYNQWHNGYVIVTDVSIRGGGETRFIKGYIKGGNQYDIHIFSKIQQFIDNGGNFVTFHGGQSPFTLLAMMKKNGYTFGKAYRCSIKYLEHTKCWDFCGNLKQVSNAFLFRIYEKSYVDLLIKALVGMENITYKEDNKK